MLAYILLPPAGPVLLLMLEHKSDYVRYGNTASAGCDLVVLMKDADFMPGNRACSLQSSLYVVQCAPTRALLTCFQIIHLIFSWSRVISWILFAGDVALIGFLALHAYRDGWSSSERTVLATSDNVNS